ncbi:hypothetical protein J4Q44_G00052550, partial [Coregonus suidteri]
MVLYVGRWPPQAIHPLVELSVLPVDVHQPVVSVGVVALIEGLLEPGRLVGGGAVEEGLHYAARRWAPLSPLYLPVLQLQLNGGALVHGRAALEGVQEAQHGVIHPVHLPLDPVALPGTVQQGGDVVLPGDHQRVAVYGAGVTTELRLPVPLVRQHPEVVGLTLLQSPIDKDISHLDRREV